MATPAAQPPALHVDHYIDLPPLRGLRPRAQDGRSRQMMGTLRQQNGSLAKLPHHDRDDGDGEADDTVIPCSSSLALKTAVLT